MSWSLRRRMFLGALFWTIGLFIVAGLVLMAVMTRHPDAPGVIHGAFSHLGGRISARG
ncbi:MAG: hypothetical protein H0W18_14420 [Acidobacteria bacterium]|nr:hypothetical protein [Acidobacteriota bacterium]